MSATTQEKTESGLKVIHVALYRMATRSLTEAYRTLGYKTHHGVENILGNPWEGIEKAAEATWPNVPGARCRRARFTRQDWDELWGNEYDIVTDMACPFVDQLIEAYPEAKVVVVQRDFEPWLHSFQTGVLDYMFGPSRWFINALLRHVFRSRAVDALSKCILGLFQANDRAEMEANARDRYDAYYRKIRDMVPPERRLEYKMGDEWEPLCRFLGKDVPDIPFPRLNDSKQRSQSQRRGEVEVILSSIVRLTPVVVAAAAVGYFWHTSS